MEIFLSPVWAVQARASECGIIVLSIIVDRLIRRRNPILWNPGGLFAVMYVAGASSASFFAPRSQIPLTESSVLGHIVFSLHNSGIVLLFGAFCLWLDCTISAVAVARSSRRE